MFRNGIRESGGLRKGKVLGEFVCDGVFVDKTLDHNKRFYEMAHMNEADIAEYCHQAQMYGWHISNLKIYAEPKELNEFIGLRKTKFGYMPIEMKHPPQSWCYVEEVVNDE